MNLPLPKTSQPNRSDNTFARNVGLWYDKFFDGWKDDFSGVEDDSDKGNGKFKWLEEATRAPSGDATLLTETQARLQQLVITRNGCLLHFNTDGRFVTGLGRKHPIENGFAWHHTLGVPYLPGSSVKGLLRAWAQESGGTEIDRIFGPQATRTANVGSVIMLDALPTVPVKLDADVMTPHYGPYYRDEHAATPPADWHAPTPIPFLAVATEQSFSFALLPRRSNDRQDQKDCEIAAKWLDDGLIWLGAGAKTAVGYGRFKADKKANTTAAEAIREAREVNEREAQLTARLQGLSPLAQELERAVESGHLDADKNAFSAPPFIEEWLDKLEAEPAPDALWRFSTLVHKHFQGLLENPDKKRGKKNEFHFKDRQRRIAKRLHKISGK